MLRRNFCLASGAVIASICAAKPQAPMKVVGFIGAGQLDTAQSQFVQVSRGLRLRGWQEGTHFRPIILAATGDLSAYPRLAKEMIDAHATIILAASYAGVRAVRDINHSIPIVFVAHANPVAEGLVASMSSPGNNMTGISQLIDLDEKRIDLLRLALPQLSKLGVIYDPVEWSNEHFERWAIASKRVGVNLFRLDVTDRNSFVRAIHIYRKQSLQALLVPLSLFVYKEREFILAELARYKIPAMFDRTEFSKNGGLISYGLDTSATLYRLGEMAADILSGSRAGNMPVERPKKFVLAINLATARVLGIAIRPSILKLADEVF